MKIVFASTPSQEEKICELVGYIYSNIFPLYFTDEEINRFEKLKILHTSKQHFEEFSTLKDAFQVMASIQTLISILESHQLDDQYEAIFNKNVANLHDFGLFFPFEFEQFAEAKSMKNTVLSIYTKADNQLLI
ncbi:YhcU family protein [Neobacillus rhizophilus]|uniref:YhcU family protein n=1 Tax=Neobacillus rhizophilus TaxID=2833579 RepID=A0A942U2Z7_9BACI|nr:YhcU family protein [Neobacillus rhizophilus]MBS4212285.1 YhcU family protein [Neobacillus rhizophilus]MBU8915720.1 YhcU family protein [Bacillus sp. FJAT-29953]